MEIKFELDTEKAAKAVVTIAATLGLCQVSERAGNPLLATANEIVIVTIIVIIYGPRQTLNKAI